MSAESPSVCPFSLVDFAWRGVFRSELVFFLISVGIVKPE